MTKQKKNRRIKLPGFGVISNSVALSKSTSWTCSQLTKTAKATVKKHSLTTTDISAQLRVIKKRKNDVSVQ